MASSRTEAPDCMQFICLSSPGAGGLTASPRGRQAVRAAAPTQEIACAGSLASGRPRSRHPPVEKRYAAMTLRLAHRGPDADGHWVPADTPVALGHRRLSILDLSATGAQPMWSANGRYVISFNGEIYNYPRAARAARTRRRRLPRHVGYRGAARRIRGVGDRGRRCARPRACSRSPSGTCATRSSSSRAIASGRSRSTTACATDSLVFASELKAIRQHPHFEGEIDRGAVALLDAIRLRARALLHLPQHRQGRAGHAAPLPAARRARAARSRATGRRSPSLAPESPGRPSNPTPSWSTSSTCCSAARSPTRWWRTFHSARSSPAGSTRRPSSR